MQVLLGANGHEHGDESRLEITVSQLQDRIEALDREVKRLATRVGGGSA